MILKQYYLACLSHASYLIGDEGSGIAVIVDPQRDVGGYIEDARARGLEIRHVLLTHFHADFVSGHVELRERTGAEIGLGASASADYPFRPLSEGDTIALGSVRLEILETPGHTPEGISILVYDLAQDAETPHAVLTGDTLFIGDVGRPDLMASVGRTPEELAGMMYDSLRTKLLPLDDDVLVYPAHGAGSACGKNMSSETFAKLGDQKSCNWALQPMEREDFIAQLTADQPQAPAYFAWDADLNRRERPTLDAQIEARLQPVDLDRALELQAEGHLILDARDPDDYAAAHVKGSVNIGLGGRYASWAGTLLDRGVPLILLADEGREREAALRLGRIGFDHFAGFVAGGPSAFQSRKDLVRSTRRVEAPAISEMLASDGDQVVLDVRTTNEWNDDHIPGSLNVPLQSLEREIERVPRGRPLVVHCLSGYRSSIATSLLERHGFENLTDMIGGIQAWKAAELATSGAK